jgi:DNA-binding SARP family transcriptional activator
MVMYFLLLGSLEVRQSEKRIPVTAPKQRAVLAGLLLNANSEVTIDRLTQFTWDANPPITAQTTIQSYVYRLRQLLHPLVGVELKTSSDSYLLHVDPQETDLWHFRKLAADARERAAIGGLVAAVGYLRRALALWRANALTGVVGQTARHEARLLEAERIAAYEELFSLEISLGNHRQIVPELQKAVSNYQFHEALRAQLMLVLYASGRQVEALQHYVLIRRKLRDDLGIDPGHELQKLHKAILEQVSPSTLSTVVASPWQHAG